jgi:Tfp pilus assembly protein FimT
VSLIELLIVLSIAAILVAVGVQMFDDDDLVLDATTRALAADVLEAQSLAIRTRRAVGVQFDVAKNRNVFVLGDGSTPTDAAASLRADAKLTSAEVDQLIAATTSGELGIADATLVSSDFGGVDRIVFEADGTPRAGGYVQVGRRSDWLRIRVQAPSGRVIVTAP